MSVFPKLRADGRANPMSPDYNPAFDPRDEDAQSIRDRQVADRAYWAPENYEEQMIDAGRGHLLGHGRRSQ